jgi:hypothetical protein
MDFTTITWSAERVMTQVDLMTTCEAIFTIDEASFGGRRETGLSLTRFTTQPVLASALTPAAAKN